MQDFFHPQYVNVDKNMNDGKYYINQSWCNTYSFLVDVHPVGSIESTRNSIVIGVVCSKLAFVCKPCLYFTIQNWYWHIDFQWYLYNWYWQRYFNYTIDLLVLFYLPVLVETESLAVYWEWQSMKGSFIVQNRIYGQGEPPELLVYVHPMISIMVIFPYFF